MTVFLACGIVVAGLLLFWLRGVGRTVRMIVDGAAALSFLCLFVLSAASVMMTLMHGTLYLTEVHGVFRKPLFLLSGAYLGTYVFAALLEAVRSAGRHTARH